MSVRAFPKKRDSRYKEAYLLEKNVLSAEADCPEICAVCRIMELAEDLAGEGWKVEVTPFEDMPLTYGEMYLYQ